VIEEDHIVHYADFMIMRVTVKADEDTEEEVRSLYRWLKDSDCAGLTLDLVQGIPAKGTMGPVTDTITVALGGSSAIATIATAFFSWLRHRRSDVHLSIRTQAGDLLTLDATSVKSADEFTRAVVQLLGGDGNAPAGR
jgi:hypothetical protein